MKEMLHSVLLSQIISDDKESWASITFII